MTKDEMKNRISMALKDPVLQQGFEIICKENAELEEKISNLLSCQNCPGNKGGLLCQKEYEDKCLAQKIQYIKELKEENAELNAKISKVAQEILDNWCKGDDPCPHLKKRDEQLTKAKEIMNIAIEGIKHWGIVGGTERPFEKQAEMLFNLFLDKAEQFLKEVSE